MINWRRRTRKWRGETIDDEWVGSDGQYWWIVL